MTLLPTSAIQKLLVQKILKKEQRMLFCGIDPGKTGAIAFLYREGAFAKVCDFEEAFHVVDQMKTEIACAYLEEVHAMPGQGVSSTFSFGENFGWWKGVLQAFGIPFKTIRPQDWQKGLVPKRGTLTEKPSLAVARQLYPEAPLNLKKHHNRADAILIARVCYEREGRK